MTGTCDPHQAALEYAERGWRVVPILPNEKRPAINQWQHRATTDTATIDRWWMGEQSGCGVGIATGAASGIWVLDVDDMDSLYELEREHGPLPATLTSITGSGGEHQLYQWPDDGRIITNSASSVLDGIDVRGEGGQVVAPPTVHPNGNQYEWDERCNTIAVAPEWLLELVCDKHNQPAPAPAVSSGHEVSYQVGDMVLTMDSDPSPIGSQLLAAMGIGPEPAPATTAKSAPGLINLTDTPGDLYAAANDWHQILTPDGWQLHHTDRNGERYWVRPGKELNGGIGATTGNTANDNMHVFTSSVPHLKAEETYTKLGYFAATHHGGDHSAAARQLAADGYRTDPTTSPHSGEVVSTAADGDSRDTSTDPYTLRIIKGGTFVYDIPETTPAVWGQGDQILWAEGEPLMIAGPTGTGKSTIAAQLVAGRLGLTPNLFGLPIADDGKPVLYLALDRPSQLKRLLNRLFINSDARTTLDDRLLIWSGPLTALINNQPGLIAAMAKHHGAGTVIVDSLFNAAGELTDAEAGSNINRAFQLVVADGIELLVLHHQRKANQDTAKPLATIDQIFGSALITAGMGSVIGIAGAAGDPQVKLSHLKQPADQVGPYTVEHDNQSGLTKIVGQFDAESFLKNRKKTGATAKQCAQAMFNADAPKDLEIAKAKRVLEALHRTKPHSVTRTQPPTGGNGGQQAITWHYIASSIESL